MSVPESNSAGRDGRSEPSLSVHAEPVDLRTLKTREQVIAHYHELDPLLAAYRDIVHEHQGPPHSINDPWVCGIDERAAAGLALARIGRPARDTIDVVHALAHIREIQAEMESLYPRTDPTIQDHVIAALFPFAGCVPTADAWQAEDSEERNGVLAEIVARIRDTVPADGLYRLLSETLEFAMPAILRQITADHGPLWPRRIRETDVFMVRQRNRMDEVIGEYVALHASPGGSVLTGICPFHGGTTSSFSVRPSSGTFHCSDCREGGDMITFVMKIEHIGFAEAVERLAKRGGVELSYEDGSRE